VLSADTQRYDANLRRPLPGQIQLADGTLGLMGPDGVVRPAVGSDGNPVKPLTKKEDAAVKRDDDVRAAISKTAGTLLPDIAGVGKPATAEHISQARLQAAQIHGLQVAKGKAGDLIVNINGEWQPL